MKRKRKEKGAKQLAEFTEEKEKQVEASRQGYRENAKGHKNQNYVVRCCDLEECVGEDRR